MRKIKKAYIFMMQYFMNVEWNLDRGTFNMCTVSIFTAVEKMYEYYIDLTFHQSSVHFLDVCGKKTRDVKKPDASRIHLNIKQHRFFMLQMLFVCVSRMCVV